MNPENTLLGLAGNLLGFDVPKSMTSADLPTFRETAHSFMDDLIQKQEAKMSEVLYPDGKNIFGQPTQPFTRGDLESLMMGVIVRMLTHRPSLVWLPGIFAQILVLRA